MRDDTPRLVKMLDAVSQFGNVSWPFWDHRTTTSNESISGRAHRERRWIEPWIDAMFPWQHNPKHCEQAHLNDLERARQYIAAHEKRSET